ncbi:MAG: DUF1223 domain-containing protein [Deltaproteobacteria bacterium]|nr:DUF1223 domain-containing protein [Deltaproteobacteria bacterium]
MTTRTTPPSPIRGRRALAVACVLLVAGGVALAARLLLPTAEASPPAAGARPPVDPGAVPVLVELFTSEGCSSCPPADAVLAKLERTQPVAGARIVPLGLHVDYWDRLGWTDPFASAKISARQRGYAGLGSGSYTPQAVIDGRAETVGSREAATLRLIAEAAKRPHASIAIEVTKRDEQIGAYDIAIRAGALPADAAGDAELVATLTQSAARVAVTRGENGGSTLEHTAIARELVTLGPAPREGGAAKASLRAPVGVPARELTVVVFAQERGSRRVLGTATKDLVTP